MIQINVLKNLLDDQTMLEVKWLRKSKRGSRSCVVWGGGKCFFLSLCPHQCWFVTGKLALAETGEQDALVSGGGLEKGGLGKTNWLCAVQGAECDWP